MDRDSHRRHRHASGEDSVTVAELQAKSTPAEPERAATGGPPVRSAVDLSGRAARVGVGSGLMTGLRVSASSVGAVGRLPVAAVARLPAGIPAAELQRADEPPEETASSNPLTKTIMVMLAAMAACGVIAAVGALNGASPHRLSPSTPALRPAVMAGPVVMRPDLLDDQLSSATGAQTDAAVQVEPVRPDQPRPAERQRAERVVIAFYHALPLRPDRAFEMLGPGMQGEGKRAFESAWESAKDVEPTIIGAGPAGEVVVSVTISRWDTSALLTVVQSISVSEGPQPLIVWAELRSAHRG